MLNQLKDTYRRFPSLGVFGTGQYSYVLFCIDNMSGNRYKYDVYGNSLDEALAYASQGLSTGYSFTVLDDTSLEVYFTNYPSYISYLFV